MALFPLSLKCRWIAVFAIFVSVPAFAASGHYALILSGEPAIKTIQRGATRNSPQYFSARQAVMQRQQVIKDTLAANGIHVTGSSATLVNAVFVLADRSDVPRLKAIPGVVGVVYLPLKHYQLDKAAPLIDAPAAWSYFGGIGSAGSGIKIGIVDTGIDATNGGFQDATLTPPSGFPKCDVPSNCAFTNNKVIVARSYVAELAGSGGPSQSHPDDVSARDRVGHGTAVAMCAGGNTVTAPLATIQGIAPHAFLGNYKVFGSSGVNDGAIDSGIISALDDAFNDGMDVAVLSLGSLAFSGPLDNNANLCGGVCDPLALAVNNLVASNQMLVVTAAGNDGADGYLHNEATYGTIDSPGDAPAAIAVAATGNSRQFEYSISVNGGSVPANLDPLLTIPGDGPLPPSPITAPLIDAANVGDQQGCEPFNTGVFSGGVALLERGGASACTFMAKVQNAEAAGAIGVIIYDNESEQLGTFVPGGLTFTSIPLFLVSMSDGETLKSFVDANSGVTATLSGVPALSVPASDVNQVTYFSSHGPALGGGLKPDVAAPGENIYTAAQRYDPTGELYDASGFAQYSGTSFATPITAGAAALVKQAHPNFTTAQIKSAIVNTATSDTSDPYIGLDAQNNNIGMSPSGALSVGGGKVEAYHAVLTNVTVEPATLSFGVTSPTFASGAQGIPTGSQNFTVTNQSTGPLTLSMSVVPNTAMFTGPTPTLNQSNVTLQAGQAASITASLSGNNPGAGIYEGAILINGGAQTLHIPYQYVIGDGVPFELVSLAGDSETGTVGQPPPDGFSALQVTDQFGVPVVGLPVSWTAPDGGSVDLSNSDSQTDQYGIAIGATTLGSTPGNYDFRATLQGFTTYDFSDSARAVPTISNAGVVNAATFQAGNGIAPGSFIAIFGTNLSDPGNTAGATFTPLPLQIDLVSVGFDGASCSGSNVCSVEAPAYLDYVSSNQINAVVPWELAGQSSAQMKVNIEFSNGQLVTVPVTTYSPGVFQVPEGGSQIAAATDLSGHTISSANPAVRGNVISIYCNGLGPVSNQPADGAPASANPLSETPTLPQVTIGGQTAIVGFSGLTPGLVSLYQLNVTVPAGIGTGVQPVSVSIGGVAAPTVNIPVQ